MFPELFLRKKYKEEDITGVYVNCAHMCRTSCYSFWLGNQDENTVFSAYYSEDDGRIEIKDVEVPAEELHNFIQLAKKILLIDELLKYRDKKNLTVPDKTEYNVEIKFVDGSILCASCPGINKEMLKFFYDLSEQYR